MEDLIGRTLHGKFVVTAHLGEGAMGSVFRATDTAAGREVALKVMRPGLMQEPGMLTRFRREATAMRRVKHPNAVEVLAHGVDQGMVFLAMELVEGTDLSEHMARKGRFAPQRAARILADVCDALAEAHAHGLVHRDIKPENIMLGGPDHETVKLIDFGIAKPTQSLTSDSQDGAEIDDSIPESVRLTGLDVTTAGTLIGSPGYMAPEQWATHGVDARTDVYACGVVLYVLVTGRMPFEAENAFTLASMQLKHRPVPPDFLNPAVSDELSAIILRALRPRPEDRFQSAAEMRDALRALATEPAAPQALEVEPTVPAQFSLRDQLGVADFSRTEILASTLPALDFDDEPAQDEPVPPPAVWSSARNGRPSSIPPSGPLARVTPVPRNRAALVSAQLRLLLPLAAAFLALGLALGVLLFFPGH
jgi:serine/threonine-protein kinase